MANLIKPKIIAFIGISALLGVGTFLSRHESSKTEETTVTQKKTPEKKTPPSSPVVDNFPDESVQETPPVVSNASIPKESLASLRDAFSAMGQFKNRDRDKNDKKEKNKKMDPAEKAALNAKIKSFRGEISKTVKESEVARKQLLEFIKDEKDPYVKKELARLLGSVDPTIQGKYYTELAGDPAVDNQKVAVEMLGNLHSENSLKSLVGMAENSSVNAEVRGDSVRAIGMSIAFATGNEEYQQSARTSLIGMIQPQQDAAVRESAYRAIAMQTALSPDEQKVVTQAAQSETDPKVKRLAEFTLNVINARKGTPSP